MREFVPSRPFPAAGAATVGPCVCVKVASSFSRSFCFLATSISRCLLRCSARAWRSSAVGPCGCCGAWVRCIRAWSRCNADSVRCVSSAMQSASLMGTPLPKPPPPKPASCNGCIATSCGIAAPALAIAAPTCSNSDRGAPLPSRAAMAACWSMVPNMSMASFRASMTRSRILSCKDKAMANCSSASTQRRSASASSASTTRRSCSSRSASRSSSVCCGGKPHELLMSASFCRSAFRFTIIALKTRKSSTLSSCSTRLRCNWLLPDKPCWQKRVNCSAVTESSLRCAVSKSSISVLNSLWIGVYSSLFSSTSSKMPQYLSTNCMIGAAHVGDFKMATTE
mmetsp:Transcript_71708/g.160894  ORF Transcript_71708/g.160894 Transcript_71708/m.160894 type:complete len:339 (+) Transcript_71708:3-1019(+)